MTVTQLLLALVVIACSLSLVMSLAWAIEQSSGNSGWIDTVWTFGLGAVGVGCAMMQLPSELFVTPRQWIVAAAILIWSLRLGTHIALRSAKRHDDPRYARLRSGWGVHASWQMWLLAQKQAIVSIPMALSIWLAAHNPAPGLRAQDILGFLIVAVAIGGEALADRQLKQFTRDNANTGAVCDVGLWGWSRHPNYFFEWFGWLAYPVIAIDWSGTYPYGWLALVGPACMYWLLVYVSGIPPLEEHMLERRGEAFRAYQAKTNAFFPAPPRAVSDARPA
jgi:steroid 5-alpha reductase family enzyme